MSCHSSGPEQTSDTSTMWPHPLRVGILAPGGYAGMRAGESGRTCGVETKCMLSLHIICSGMHLIKGEEAVAGLSTVCLCLNATAVCVHVITFHNTTKCCEFLRVHGFPRPLILCEFSCKVWTHPDYPDWAWETRCSLYSLNQSWLPGGRHPYTNNTRLK